jgi:stage II sporulation protein M
MENTFCQNAKRENRPNLENTERRPFSFKAATNAVKEGKLFILAAIIIFFIGVIYGMNAPIENYNEHFESLLSDWDKRLSLNSQTKVILVIFFNNLSVAATSIWLAFIVGLKPIASALINGRDIGILASASFSNGTFTYYIFGIAPHGVFEIPAMFIAWGLGIWCAKGLVTKKYKERVLKANRVLVFYIAPLLAVAAIIEGISLN